MHEYAIETRDITKIFRLKPGRFNFKGFFSGRKKAPRQVLALDHVNLKIKNHELFGILGPNGAGKTTFIKVISTLLLPDYGESFINGFNVIEEQINVKECLGTLFSVGERGFFWRLSGYENLKFYAAMYNVPKGKREQRVKEVLEDVGLKEWQFQPFQKYSGGTKRRLAIARALIHDPPILLLDEPTLELDATSAKKMRNFIKDTLCGEQGKTILYTTHHLEEADQMCQRVAILNHGKIMADGSPDALKEGMRKIEIIEFLVNNIGASQITSLRNMPCVLDLTCEKEEIRSDRYKLRLQLDNLDSLHTVLDFIHHAQVRILDLKHIQPTLEDVFMHFTS